MFSFSSPSSPRAPAGFGKVEERRENGGPLSPMANRRHDRFTEQEDPEEE
jgi:hypothetical protein